MFRKSIVAAAVAISAAAFVPVTASAGGGYHGYHGGHHQGLHHRGNTLFHGGGHHGWRGFHGLRGRAFASCWRWVPTRFGYAKAWVCG
jgi:hypothetical protein